MKIAHLCLACFYIPGMSYQENILPKKHKEDGHDVIIISSTYCFDKNGRSRERLAGEFINEDRIKVFILPYKKGRMARHYKIYDGLAELLEKERPDLIFCHGTHFMDIEVVIKYKKRHPDIVLVADHHGDYYNNGLMNASKLVYFKRFMVLRCIWGGCARRFAKYGEIIWGVTPQREQFLQDVYLVPKNKTGLLIMGADEAKIHFGKKTEIRSTVRSKYGIDESAFLIVSGGKIDRAKNIHLLIEAVTEIDNSKIQLVVFGEPNEDMKNEFSKYVNCSFIHLVGWMNSDQIYDLYLAADMAIFPGTHSVLWEQACACGLPCFYKHWDGMHHVDLDGNCRFLYENSSDEIKENILDVFSNKQVFSDMKCVSEEKGLNAFSYQMIARKAIGFRH